MPDYTTTKQTTSGATRALEFTSLCYESATLTATAKVGAVIDLGSGEVRGEIAVEVGGGGTYAGGTTILLEGSAVVGMTSPEDLVTYTFSGTEAADLKIPFTTKIDSLGTPKQFVRLTVTPAGSDTYTSSAWLTINKV